jgi:hypothetical protein
MKKIAFCFLIYDKIEHEDFWYLFFKDMDPKSYTIYIHYKHDIPLNYFESYKLKHCIETKYENETIPLAYNVLFREAFKDKDNYKFINVSNTCIPLKSFASIYKKLVSDDKGYFNVCPQSQCFPNCNSLRNVIDEAYISKSHNWFILNRTLVENLCMDDAFIKKHYTIYAPAEYYYYTFIKILHLEEETIVTHNVAEATTFTNWEGMNYKYPSTRGLKNYRVITEEELLYLFQSPSLFGRKFYSGCIDLLSYKKYI